MIEKIHKKLAAKSFFIFLIMILYKIITEIGFELYLHENTFFYTGSFDVIRCINGWIWFVILFWAMKHEERKISQFFLEFQYVIQIVPITAIYTFTDGSAIYYNVLCTAFLLCISIVRLRVTVKQTGIKRAAKKVLCVMAVLLTFVLFYIILENGLPTLKALNIYAVYELRSSGQFVLNKYVGYVFKWIMIVVLPFFIARALEAKRYGKCVFFLSLVIIFYLYCGHKDYLFSLPLILIIFAWSKRKYFNIELYTTASLGLFFLVLFSQGAVFVLRIYSLFERRVLLEPANLKFKYFDYFSAHQKIGLSGTFLGKFLGVEPVYEESIGSLIGLKYFGQKTNANTGFLAEGYYRFGFIGIFISLILFAVLLRYLDRIADKIGYRYTLAICIYPIYRLIDTSLIASLLLEEMFWLCLVLWLYKKENDRLFTRRKHRKVILIK